MCEGETADTKMTEGSWQKIWYSGGGGYLRWPHFSDLCNQLRHKKS